MDEQAAVALFRSYLELHPDIGVVNCAAYTSLRSMESNPERGWDVNAIGPGRLYRALVKAAPLRTKPGSRLVHVSTDYVFGGSGVAPYGCTDMPHPATWYGRSKLAGEASVLGRMMPSVPAYVVRMSFLPYPLEFKFVFDVVRCTKEWVEDAAKRLARFCSSGVTSGLYASVPYHLVPRETTLAKLVHERYPLMPVVPVSQSKELVGYDYPADVRLG
jgi:dTDP-4-dehydrorhamnose reductase